MRAKHLGRALEQLAEEGAAHIFKPLFGGDVDRRRRRRAAVRRARRPHPHRVRLPVHFEGTGLYTARWVESDDAAELKRFLGKNQASTAEDHTGATVFLARNDWHLDTTAEEWPALRFLKTKEQVF